MLDLYVIRPLKWKDHIIHWIAEGSSAIYRVWLASDSRQGVLQISTQTFKSEHVFNSMADAKDAAEKHHRNELLGWLDKFNPDEWSCVAKGDSNV